MKGESDRRQQTATRYNCGAASERKINKLKVAKARTAFQRRLLEGLNFGSPVCFLYTAVVILLARLIGFYLKSSKSHSKQC